MICVRRDGLKISVKKATIEKVFFHLGKLTSQGVPYIPHKITPPREVAARVAPPLKAPPVKIFLDHKCLLLSQNLLCFGIAQHSGSEAGFWFGTVALGQSHADSFAVVVGANRFHPSGGTSVCFEHNK